jgi:hypothetical protein
MAEFTVEFTGPTRDQLALELSTYLRSPQGNVQVVTRYTE